jgi:hypothetical protein
MSQQEISSLENDINVEKVTLLHLEQEKSRIQMQFNSKKQELLHASERALQSPSSGPLQLVLLREAVEVEAKFQQENSQVENQIQNVKRNLTTKERQLATIRNVREQNRWSTTFK